MQMYTKENDVLKGLFEKVPTEQLPEGFREQLMQHVRKEAVRIQRRKEQVGLLAVIMGAICMLLIGIAGIYVYLSNVGQASGLFDSQPLGYVTILQESSYGIFFVWIGALSLFLLMADFWLRRLFFKHRLAQEEKTVK